MKLAKRLSIFSLLFIVLFSLASCNLESYADKVNEAFKNGEPLSFKQVMKDLGKDACDLTASLGGKGNSGVVIKVKGCSSWEDIQAKIDEGKDVKGIVVTFVAGSATGAVYRAITANDAK